MVNSRRPFTDSVEGCLKMIRKPVVDEERFQRVWQKEVLPLTDTYEMNP